MRKSLLAMACILPAAILLSACSKSEQEQKQAERASPFETQQQALEKARQVEQLIQDTEEKHRQEIERQGG